MSTDILLNLLQYLVSVPEGQYYVELIDNDIFTSPVQKVAFTLLKEYYRKYHYLPSKDIATLYFSDAIKASKNIPKGFDYDLMNYLTYIYSPINEKDKAYIKDQIINIVREKKTSKAVLEYTRGNISINDLQNRLSEVSSLNLESKIDTNKLLIEDFGIYQLEKIEAYPTFLEDLNELTAAKGFYPPQLIVFMSSPKHFKTGMMIKLAVEYARSGINVYYADNENGEVPIRNRCLMAICEADLDWITDPGNKEEIKEYLTRFKKYGGGDIFIDSFGANSVNLYQIETRLQYLKVERNFVPKIIIYDTLDKFLPVNWEKEKRLRLQNVYNDAINLNKKLNVFSFTVSQVKQQALEKRVLKPNDISEDYGKVANAHAIFAICGTKEEMDLGIRRIVPVAQREGKRYTPRDICVIQINEATMTVNEVFDKEPFIYLD